MSALYPMMASPEDFKPGDCVRKFVTMSNVTPFCGVVTHLAPVAGKVWVQWPVETASESPETLIKVNPMIFGFPTVTKDHGYNSYEKEMSEKLYGRIPKKATEQDKMAIRIAHTFATEVVGKLVGDIVDCKNKSLTDVQAYNRIYDKYSDICSDYIIQSSIKKVYAVTSPQALHQAEAPAKTTCNHGQAIKTVQQDLFKNMTKWKFCPLDGEPKGKCDHDEQEMHDIRWEWKFCPLDGAPVK